MDRPLYTQILTPEERAQCMKLGAMTKLAEFGHTKEADSALSFLSPSNVARAVIGVSLLGGVPLGIAAYQIGKRINTQKGQEREMLERIKHYRNAASGLEGGLAAPTV